MERKEIYDQLEKLGHSFIRISEEKISSKIDDTTFFWKVENGKLVSIDTKSTSFSGN